MEKPTQPSTTPATKTAKALESVLYLALVLIVGVVLGLHEHISYQGFLAWKNNLIEAKFNFAQNISLHNTWVYDITPSFRQQRFIIRDKAHPYKPVKLPATGYIIQFQPLTDPGKDDVILVGNRLWFSRPGWYLLELTITQPETSPLQIDFHKTRVLFNIGQPEDVWKPVVPATLQPKFLRLISHLHQHNLLFDHRAMVIFKDRIFKSTTTIASDRTGTRFTGWYSACVRKKNAIWSPEEITSHTIYNKNESCQSWSPKVRMARPHLAVHQGKIFSVGGTPEDAFNAGIYDCPHQVWTYDPESKKWQRLADLPISGQDTAVADLFVHQGRLMSLVWKADVYHLLAFDLPSNRWITQHIFTPPARLGMDIHYFRGSLIYYEPISYDLHRLPDASRSTVRGCIQRLDLSSFTLSTLTWSLAEERVRREGGHPVSDKPDSYFIYVWENRLYLFVQDRIFQYTGPFPRT